MKQENVNIDVTIPIKGKCDQLNFNNWETLLSAVRNYDKGDIEVHIVEQGDKALNNKIIPYQFKYHFVRSPIWNKPSALNKVLFRSDKSWCVFLDGDYIVPCDFFNKLYGNLIKDNVFIQCRGYNLPESFNTDSFIWDNDTALTIIKNHKCTPRPKLDFGGCQIVPTREAYAIGGFNEHIKLYGAMHHEFRNRLVNYGLVEKDLHAKIYLLHQYHPPRLINNEPVTSNQMYLQRQYNRELARLAHEKKIAKL